MGGILIGGTAAMLMCVFLSPRFIEWLRAKSFGQFIREEGPAGHKTKAGTPTMGGLIIFVAIAVPYLILGDYSWTGIGVFVTAISLAAVGFVDDWRKVVRKRSLGISGRTKLGAMIVVSLFLWLATREAGLDPTLRLRSLDLTIDLGPLYPVFIYLVVAGTANAVNLTDGLDGLAAGTSAIVLTAYIGITFELAGGTDDLSLLTACAVGGCVGFLWFNAYPATVFMGDTGSLGLGGLLAAVAIMTKTEELLVLIGGVFVVEALSVIIQVLSFKSLRKRVFLMAPIHHHFEMKAWSETKIILRFWIVAIACSAIGFTLFQQSIR